MIRAKTFLGSIKTYHQNTDGTWQTDGKTYLYRLKITGRMHDAVRDSTFVYLSNLKTITFDQAWKAAGFSSNSADYFSPEDAVLVDWPDADVSQVGGADTASVIIDGKLFLDGAVSDAILAQNAGDSFPDGPINTEAHAILGVESKSGTPLAGQTNHMEEITIYIQYVYNRYTVSDGTLERAGGICTPAMLTFSGDADNYTLKAFWEPQGGSNYAQEIRDRFPAEIANIVLDPQNEIVNTDELENRCLAQAEAYLADHTN